MVSIGKKPIIGGIIAAIIGGIVVFGAQIESDDDFDDPFVDENVIWSVRISGSEFPPVPKTVSTNLFLENLVLYKFGFVPMGDSPESIKITITNPDGRLAFIEEFVLEKTLIDTGISKYYTWDYEGDDVFDFNSRDCHMNKKNCNYEMTVQRIGDLKGSVSISLFEVKRTV